jgi:hypothetical protein
MTGLTTGLTGGEHCQRSFHSFRMLFINISQPKV